MISTISGCDSGSGSSDGGEDEPHEQTSTLVGADGGVIELDEVSLIIPPGALSEDTQISVESHSLSVDGFEPVSAAYLFSPHGLIFNLPVTISFQLAQAVPDARLFRGEDATTAPVEVADATFSGSEVSATISGFSYYVVGTHTNPIIDTDDGFDFEGAHYTSGPVSQEIIDGFAYSYAEGAGVFDGEGSGHVWYGIGSCMTFRPDGSGVLDRAGGTIQRLQDFPSIYVEWLPGTPQNVLAASSQGAPPVGTEIPDPAYDRRSELSPFRWGVRLNDDGTIYENFDGHYETRLEFEDGSPGTMLEWDPSTNTHYTNGYDPLTTDLPAENHFCSFRETVSTSVGDSHMRCVETVEEWSGGVSFVEKFCYAAGMLQGDYSMTDVNGVVIEAGSFEDNRPVGGWMLRDLDGVLQATGSFDENGMHQGEWETYDWQGNRSARATFKGGLNPSGRGTYYRVLDGPYEEHKTSSTGTTYLAEAGSLVDGKRSGPWYQYDEMGGLTSEQNYDLATQIPSGEWCFRLEEGGSECVPVTLSLRNNARYYDWGGCRAGSFIWTEHTYDSDGSSLSMVCYELEGTPQEPTRGAERSCGSACSQ